MFVIIVDVVVDSTTSGTPAVLLDALEGIRSAISGMGAVAGAARAFQLGEFLEGSTIRCFVGGAHRPWSCWC